LLHLKFKLYKISPSASEINSNTFAFSK